MGLARIGVFGGTFDPVHMGHLVAAVNVRYELRLDVVLMVVAGSPWQKEGNRRITPAEDRFAVVEAAVAQTEGVEASRIEIDRGGPSYMADTLSELSVSNPGAELFLIGGTDMADGLSSWSRPAEVAALAHLVVVNRPSLPVLQRPVPDIGPPLNYPDLQVHHVEIPALDISSTDLRRRLVEGRPLDFLIPQAAIVCLRSRLLYCGDYHEFQDNG